MSKSLRDGEPISSLNLDSCDSPLLADVLSLMCNLDRYVRSDYQGSFELVDRVTKETQNVPLLLYPFRNLSLEDMVGLLSCVKQLLLPNKGDRFVHSVFNTVILMFHI